MNITSMCPNCGLGFKRHQPSCIGRSIADHLNRKLGAVEIMQVGRRARMVRRVEVQ